LNEAVIGNKGFFGKIGVPIIVVQKANLGARGVTL